MSHLFDLGQGRSVHELADEHLATWGEMARAPDIARWFEWHQFSPSTLAEIRRLRGDWPEAVQQRLPQQRELVVLDNSGAVVAGAVLAGYACPVDWEIPSVEFAYAVHPDWRGNGIATDLLRTLPPWIESDVGTRHTWGGVCTTNTRSISLLTASDFDLITTVDGCVGANDQRRHSCANREKRYCWGHH